MNVLKKFSIYTLILASVSFVFVSCEEKVEEATISSAEEGVVINGIRWATRNIAAPGVFAANPEDAGLFYQWDTIVGWNVTEYSLDNVMVQDSSIANALYTLSTNGDTAWVDLVPLNRTSAWLDSRSNFPTTPDTISWSDLYNICPPGWRLPTKAEVQSLINSGYSWRTVNGKEGCVFGKGDNAIFLPASGYRSRFDGSLLNSTIGFYWTKDAISKSIPYLFFQERGVTLGNTTLKKGEALTIRCVKIE